MIIIFKNQATSEELKKVAEDLDGYIKFVVDVAGGILAAGGEMHVDCEKLLLNEGSSQKDLWGGGLDLSSNEIDFNSMINLRPTNGNSSRDVLDAKTREKMQTIVRKFLK